MHKGISDLVGTLGTSVKEIAASGRDDRDELLTKSLGEFQETLFQQLEDVLPVYEPLQKGMNHIACFAQALRDIANRVDAMKSGRPGWMLGGDSEATAKEKLPADISDMLDNFVHVGVLTLQAMVNDTAEMPIDDDALERAERAGELAKIECWDGEELLLKTALPPEYHEFLIDPVELVSGWAEAARHMTAQAVDLAEPMAKAELLPDVIYENYPELFEDPLTKDFPPKKKRMPGTPGSMAGTEADGDETVGDETVGDGGNPDAAQDPGSDEIDDDSPNSPLEMITRLASIIVVIAGSLSQNAGSSTDPDTVGGGYGGAQTSDDSYQSLNRSAPEEMTLQKIYAGEVEVDPALADALEELEFLRKRASDADKAADELQKLKETVARLSKVAAAPKGATMALGKREDNGGASQTQEARVQEVAELAKRNPEAAARELIKSVHGGGGTPLVPGHLTGAR